ncbi:MAG: hypothetical protein JWN21_2058 [Sphingomonas bacterium]|uniref:phage tail protein n=1 Tax=Sphingomonas bacterium TaxID=1895847 RepID=UPI002617705E|nr:phage tail protein [Sphingomonas bacterium]MDB5696515.1 hypothetical protein [Sphingomonas bacterium]
MATLVLTAVGGVLGGPVGAALGALAGRAVDARLLAPKGREGPRLTELRVQTSSYGTPIPKLFGTMRVAGTVIWSTDLIERRATSRAGKGQPSTTRYSYSASFAVLLSARPVLRVGRVWADGQLIRGAEAEWKVPATFRLHLGGEEQVADPLIASAEGAGLAPAHRGHAYAVFEDLALEPFGDRLPNLTFEVVADEEPVTVGAIAAELAAEVSGGASLLVDGFAGVGGSVGAVLESLATASGAWFAPDGAGLVMRDGGPPALTMIEQDGRAASREVAAADTAPAVVTVSHYDPARDWQAGLQRARRPAPGGPTLAMEVPAAISAGAAKGIAEAALARGEAARVRRTLPARLDALRLAPGDVVGVAGESGSWRVDEVVLEAMAASVVLSPLARAPVAAAASAGRVLAQVDLPVGRTLLHAVELPALDDSVLTQPRLLVVACGTGAGWRGAPLLLSLDAGASWTEAGATAAPGVIGTVVEPAGAAPATLIDKRHTLVVELARGDMALDDADAAALDRGANLALVGDELVQFGTAEPLGDGRWRLRGLWRGRRGTLPSAGVAGSRFVLLGADTTSAIDLPLAALGGTVRIMAAGVGDVDEPSVATANVAGVSVLPLAPIGLRWTATGEGGAVVSWLRRSRAGWRWLDGVDAPLGEESEHYRVTIGAREELVTTPAAIVTATDRAAGPVTVTVRQRGTFGESAGVTITL